MLIIEKANLLLVFGITAVLFSCSQPADKTADKAEFPGSSKASAMTDKKEALNVDSLVRIIDQSRAEIEKTIKDPVVVSTANLREKIKQKWEKIHFYSIDGKVVRVKTYAYPSISTRTEEFYLENGKLIVAVIEDNGEGERGKSEEEIDKMYYFNNDKFIKEVKPEGKAEFSIENSDALELLSEAKEYLDIYSKQTQE